MVAFAVTSRAGSSYLAAGLVVAVFAAGFGYLSQAPPAVAVFAPDFDRPAAAAPAAAAKASGFHY